MNTMTREVTLCDLQETQKEHSLELKKYSSTAKMEHIIIAIFLASFLGLFSYFFNAVVSKQTEHTTILVQHSIAINELLLSQQHAGTNLAGIIKDIERLHCKVYKLCDE